MNLFFFLNLKISKQFKYQKEKKLQLIQEFDINISLENCISPDEVSLTKLK